VDPLTPELLGRYVSKRFRRNHYKLGEREYLIRYTTYMATVQVLWITEKKKYWADLIQIHNVGTWIDVPKVTFTPDMFDHLPILYHLAESLIKDAEKTR